MNRVVAKGVAPLLAALVVVLAGCGVEAPSAVPGSAADPIAWSSSPGIAQVNGSVPATRACAAADLSVQAGRTGAVHGFATQELLLTNHGQEACFLPGPPTTVVILTDGSRRQVGGSSSTAVAGRVDLAVGQTAQLLLGTPGTCPGAGHPQVGSRVELTLASGEHLSASNTWVNVECGAATVVAFTAGAAPLADVPASRLSATINVPRSAAPGGALQYFITLTNPATAAIPLSPCPSYTETLGASPALVVRQTYLLNCSLLPSIGAGAAGVFEMRLSVPAAMPIGATKLSWTLQVPNGPSAGTTLQVT